MWTQKAPGLPRALLQGVVNDCRREIHKNGHGTQLRKAPLDLFAINGRMLKLDVHAAFDQSLLNALDERQDGFSIEVAQGNARNNKIRPFDTLPAPTGQEVFGRIRNHTHSVSEP